MARRRFRNTAQQFQLCSADGPLGPKVIARISSHKGERLVKERKARCVYDANEKLVGYQLLEAKPDVVIARTSGPSSTVFSAAERDAIVGLRGESRTQALSEGKRLSRLRRGLREMDLVEAAAVKLSVYPFVH